MNSSRLFTLLMLSACSCCLHAEQPTTATGREAAEAAKSIRIPRTSTPPTLDGVLDEAMWASAAKVDEFYQMRPGDGTPSSERTDVYLAYDDNAIYIGAKLWDPLSPHGIAASTMKQGAQLSDDDRIAVFFDTFNTQRTGYRFGVNANGVRNDQLVNGDDSNPDWSVIWDARARTYEGYWIVEFAIPFKSLPFNPANDTWGLNFGRAIRRRGEETAWVTRNRKWSAAIAGSMSGLTGMKQGLGLDVVPGVVVSTRTDHVADHQRSRLIPSLDAYYRLTPSLNASLTVNTDFSGTDIDDRQVNLGRFGLFFPEKRDFFLNDSEQFEFGRITGGSNDNNNHVFGRASQENGRPFFSRRLGLGPTGDPADIDFGAKLSGRAGRWNIGALAMQQGETLLRNGGQFRPDVAMVARLSANVFSESTVGGIVTSGNTINNDRNSLLGIDFNYRNSRLGGNHILTGEMWAQKSQSSGLKGRDAAYGAGISLPNENGWRAALNVRELQENFNPALGYVNVTGVRQYAADLGYTGYPRRGRIHSWYAGVDTFRLDDIVNGGLLSQNINWRASIANTLDDSIAVAAATMKDTVYQAFTLYSDASGSVSVQPGSYLYSDAGVFFNTGPSHRMNASLNFTRGQFYNGHYSNISSQLTWKQSRHLTAAISGELNHIRLPSGTFINRIMSLTTSVGFTSRVGWSTVVQYDNRSEVLGLQTNLYWIPQAGQRFNLVLNHAMEDTDRDLRFRPLVTELRARANYTFRF